MPSWNRWPGSSTCSKAAGDAGQQIVEVRSQPAGELAHRLHLLRQTQLFLSHGALGGLLIEIPPPKAMTGKPQDRTGPARTLLEDFGGTLRSYYFSLGDYDGLAICELPDNTSAMACSMKAASTGAFQRFETTPLLTAQEAEAAMRKVQNTQVAYTPPNA